MSRIPDRSTALWILLALALAVGSWLWVHRELPYSLWSGDANEYAEIARRLANGEGFTTGVIFPVELTLGATRDHPVVMRPPLWPLVLSPFFAAFGPRESVVHGVVLLCHIATIALTMALATALAGRAIGAIAGISVAVSSQFMVFVFDGTAEPLFAALVTLTFLLLARNANPFWLGVASGLAYLARYNGLVLLPVILLFLALRREGISRLGWCVAGFAAVAAPWWLRNLAVFGDPLYSPLALNLYMSPELTARNASLLYMLVPDLSSAVAVDPIIKATRQLPELLLEWPLASANLAACLGVAWACLRRDRLSLALAAVAAATTLGIALALPMGRYFMPLLPAVLGLGAAGWARYGGRLRIPALALLLAAPWLPEIPRPIHDVAFLRAGMAVTRQAYRERRADPAGRQKVAAALSRCLSEDSLVVAQNAAGVTWDTGAVAIYSPASDADFWEIVEQHPVEYVHLPNFKRIARDRFESEFRAVPDCAPDLYERRRAPQREPPPIE